jgi:putative ABC transport system permease protein
VSIDGGLTYVEIEPGTLDSVTRQFPAVIDQNIPGDKYGPNGEFRNASYAYAFELIPLTKLHMMSWSGRYIPTHHSVLRPPGEPALVPALLITGALILFVALLNVVGLVSARATRRTTEVGVRKTAGAFRVQLFTQFMGESAFVVAAALLFALTAAKLALPGVNAFLGRTMVIDITDPKAAGVTLALMAFAALLGGLYPALVLSALRPVEAFKPNPSVVGRSGGLRSAYVLGQFAVLIALIVAVVVIDRQTRFAMTDGLRFDADQLLIIEPPCDAFMKDKISAVSGVRGVACTGPGFLTGSEAVGLQTLPDGRQFPLIYFGVDAGFMEMIGIRPLAGRLFTEGENLSGLVLNETAVRAFGFESPEDAIGKTPAGRDEVIGVVPNFSLRSLHDAPMPTTFIRTRNTARTPSITVVKLAGSGIPEALAGIDAAWETLGTGRPTPRRFYDQFVQTQYTDLVRQSQAFRILSITAIVLAALGLFGLAAFTAEQRTKEIGIRKSMGATRVDVLRLLLWQFAKPVLWANVIAWPAAYFVMRRWLEGFAYRIELAPWMFLAASGLALVIALATVSGHALMVARARPVAALRYE